MPITGPSPVLLEEAARALDAVCGKTRLLDRIQWPRKVERAFFAAHAGRLPEPEYDNRPDELRDCLAALDALEPRLRGDHPALALFRSVLASHRGALRMALAVGTPAFFALSREQYGGARTFALDADSTNLDLALHVERRLGPPGARDEEPLDASGFAERLRARVAADHPDLALEVRIDDELSAKVLAGATRVRVRADARFSPLEVESLYAHEVETHVLTAQNGQQQERLPFLRAGGPRTTRTQEGLAVFAELYHHRLSARRLRRLVERVKMVAMAEDGASFLDVYRYLAQQDVPPHEAYLDTARIFRGGLVEGGAPFTKDAAYLAGLAEVYNFLRTTVSAGSRNVVEVLVSGRIALDDVDELVALREEGLLTPPAHLPSWLAGWDALVAYFSFTSFLNEIDFAPLEQKYGFLRGPAARSKAG